MYLRIRLRGAPLTALVFAVLCFVTTLVPAVLPRLVDSYGDAALRDVLESAPAEAALLSGTLPADASIGPDGRVVAPALRPGRVDAVGRAFAKAARTLPVDTEQAVAGVTNPVPAPANDPGLPRLTRTRPPELTLTAQRGLAAHSRLVEGELPGPDVRFPSSGPDARGGSPHVEAVVTAQTARRMNLEPGDSFAVGDDGFPAVVTVTGVVEPRDAHALFWTADPVLAAPRKASEASDVPGLPPDRFWRFGVLVHRDAAEALLAFESGAEVYWHFSLPTDGIRAHHVPALASGLTSLARGAESATLARAAGAPVSVDESLGNLLAEFARDRSAVAPLLAMAAAGVLTTALIVLLLWSVLAAEQRREDLVLLRARGGSVWDLIRWSLAETAACGLPAAVAGFATAVWLVPDARTTSSLLLAAATTTVALLAMPLVSAWLHRRPLGTTTPTGGSGRRRLVAEATVLVLATGAVTTLRQHGTDGGAAPDPFAAAAPVLLSLTGAMLLLRCAPWPIRLLARAAARRSGAVGFLGLSRAGRPASAAVAGLPLLSLLSALTLASFGGTVLSGVAEARDRAALSEVGADARMTAARGLPNGLTGEVRKSEGVTDVSPVRVYQDASLLSGLRQPVLAIVDPASYARLAENTGLGAYPAGALDGGGKGEAVAALVSADLMAEWPGGTMHLVVPGLGVSVRPEVVRESTPAAPRGLFVVVSRTALERAQPDISGTALTEPDTLLIDTGDGGAHSAGTLRALTERPDAALSLKLAAEGRAAYADSVLRSGAERLYVAAVLAAGGLSALAVLLSLVQSSPERTSLLARLRALGLTRREARRLILVEAMPLYVLTATTGVLLALVSVPLLRPGIDLVALAGTPADAPTRLAVDVMPLALPALCLLSLAVVALLAQARVATRRTDPRMELEST